MRPNTLARRRSIAALLAVAAVLSAPDPARADVRTEARTHFRRGMQLIAEQRLDDGIAELQEAYDILPHPNVLYNIARAYESADRYEEALEYFQRYLESDPIDRAEVERDVAALQQRIAAQQQRAQPQVAAAPESEPSSPPERERTDVDDIRAIEESAALIEAQAEASQDPALRDRAARLRAMAERFQAEADAATAAAEPTDVPVEQPSEVPAATPQGSDTLAERETAPSSGQQREGDTYEESVVSSSRAAQSPLDAPNSTTTITAQDIRLSGLTNAGEMLRRAAGVSYLQSGPMDPQISIRGLNQRLSNRVVVLLDGRSVYLDFIGVTLFGGLPIGTEDIERIEIIRGPASALYGADAMTGIVNIISRPLGEGRSYARGGFGTNGQLILDAGVYGRADRLRFRVSGGYQRADNFAIEVAPERVDFSAGSVDPALGFERVYLNGEASYRFDGGHSLRGGTAVAFGQLAFQGLSRLRQLQGDEMVFAQTFLGFETPFGLSARVFWNRFGLDTRVNVQVPGGAATTQGSDIDRSDMVDAEVVYSQDFDLGGGISNQFIAGISYRFKEVVWEWLAGTQTQNHGGLFVQDTLRFSNVAQIVLSVRGDLHPLVGPQVSPRASVIFHPTDGQSIRLTGGAAFRSPTFTESYVRIPTSTPVRAVSAFGIGDTGLSPERLVSIELGYMNQMTEFFALELNGYYNMVFDLIQLTRNRPFRLADYAGMGRPEARYYRDLEAYPLGELQYANEAEQFQQIGGELGMRVFPVQGLDIYANYAIHETSHFNGPYGALTYDQRTSAHMINAGVQYRSEIGLDISADFSWQSEQTWAEQVLDAARGGVVFQLFRLNPYAILNARVGWRLLDDHLEVAIVGTNLIDDGHREHPFGQPIDRRFMGTLTGRF